MPHLSRLWSVSLCLSLTFACAADSGDSDNTGAELTTPSATSPTGTDVPAPSAMPTTTAPSGFAFSPGCEDVVGTLFGNPEKCGGATCHGGPGTKPLVVNLGDPSGLRERIVDVKGTYCTDLSIVDSANPDASALIEKLKAQPSCGSHMPVGGDLPIEEINCILEWVHAMARGDI